MPPTATCASQTRADRGIARAGMALVVTLAVLLVVEAMAAGMLALAIQSRLVADSELRRARADAEVTYAAASFLADWPAARFDTLPAGTTTALPAGAGAGSGTIERLARSTFLLRVRARTGADRVFALGSVLAIARMLDRERVAEELNAAVTAAGQLVVAGSARLSGGLMELPPEWNDSLCPALPPLPAAPAIRTSVPPVISETAELSGNVVVDTMLAPDSLALGYLSWRDVAQIADTVVAGSAELAIPDSSYPLIFAAGNLAVTGEGQGILAVAGVLTLAAGARFDGVIVARDGISIEPDARLFGAAAARSGDVLIESATVSHSPCALVRALLFSLASRKPVLGQRRFLPAFQQPQ